MRETIYLAIGRRGVRTMTKRLPQLMRGEIPVKVVLDIDPAAFREPVIEQHITISDWRQGLDYPDIGLEEMFITEEEAEAIRQQRLDLMVSLVRDHGYQVVPVEHTPDEDHVGP